MPLLSWVQAKPAVSGRWLKAGVPARVSWGWHQITTWAGGCALGPCCGLSLHSCLQPVDPTGSWERKDAYAREHLGQTPWWGTAGSKLEEHGCDTSLAFPALLTPWPN